MPRGLAIIIYILGFLLGIGCGIMIHEWEYKPAMAQAQPKVESAPPPQRSLEVIDQIGAFGPHTYLIRARSCYYIIVDGDHGQPVVRHLEDCPSPSHSGPIWAKTTVWENKVK